MTRGATLAGCTFNAVPEAVMEWMLKTQNFKLSERIKVLRQRSQIIIGPRMDYRSQCTYKTVGFGLIHNSEVG